MESGRARCGVSQTGATTFSSYHSAYPEAYNPFLSTLSIYRRTSYYNSPGAHIPLRRSEPDPAQADDVDMLPTHHAECFGGVKVKPGEMLGMAVEVLVVSWTL